MNLYEMFRIPFWSEDFKIIEGELKHYLYKPILICDLPKVISFGKM